jgi:Nif-specific regulatory protein
VALTIGIEGQSTPVRVGGSVITIGRAPGNDVRVPDNRISSRHGRLVRQGEGYFYEDLGSRNGSLVEHGGERIVVAPGDRVPVVMGDRLLLGDLHAPVALEVQAAPQVSMGGGTGGTVVARRALVEPGAPVGDSVGDGDTLRALFALLTDLSGRVDPDAVLDRIAEATLERFAHARSVSVQQRDGDDRWVMAHARQRESGEVPQPSETLLRRTVESREAVAYVPGTGPAPSASVIGLAGAAMVPLLAGDEAIGVLHVDSRVRGFAAQDLAWLGVVGTHVAAHLVAARRFHALSQSAERLQAENNTLRSAARLPRPIIGRSEALQKALSHMERVARTTTTVLVTGETGTGKELAARYLHVHSRRADGVFAPINCGALPEALLNSELFGHKKGAFTGAHTDRKGLFEAAEGGTVFLDEIGEISPAVQVRLLRVLQEREVQPVGAVRPIKVDVRIIAATNRDLQAEVAKGEFREDLYYRLAVFPVRLPPLRERHGDVMLLADRFREASCGRHDRWVGTFTEAASKALAGYHWPGNVRQLEHEIERAVILTDDGQPIELTALSEAITGQTPADQPTGVLPQGQLKAVMAVLEERVIRRALGEHGGNRTRAAEALGISRQALQMKLAKWRVRDAE